MRALITGITGQDGAYLANFLLSKRYEVHGLIRSHSPNLQNLNHFNLAPRLTFHQGDLTDPSDTRRVVAMGFDEIYNLGAQSFVGTSWQQPLTTTQVNALGPLHLLEAIRHLSPRTKFYQASTSEMFGNSPGPQNEDTPFQPRSPYGVAKLYGHHITKNYRESFGLFACSGILFNHESPIRGPQFVTRKISKGIAAVVAGRETHIKLGSLDAKRDWGFAGDYVRAMWLMLQQKEPGDYVVATGETHTVGEFVEAAFQEVGLDWRKHVRFDEALVRPAEVNLLQGDPRRILDLGWEPEVGFRELVRKMVQWDCYGVRI
jgi:GDPmannose 4,6-dehydratase